MEPISTTPKRNLPRDVFLHLLAMVALYWSAVSFITLCWQYVNYLFPDALSYAGYLGFAGPIRFAISSLVIVFPVFMLASWLLNRIYAKESAVRESKVRKWLIYLTLFIASLVIIGDLIFVINTFLGGEITTRFVLKALSIIVVAAVIFWYYLDDVRRPSVSSVTRYVAWGTGAVVLVSVIGAFFIVGSPATARLLQFDQQKISDLQGIQYQVVSYWQRKGILPSSLSDLVDPLSGYAVPIDPQSNQPYEYLVIDAAGPTFELCAVFNADDVTGADSRTVPKIPGNDYVSNFPHGSGRTCFERTIDPQLYPRLDVK